METLRIRGFVTSPVSIRGSKKYVMSGREIKLWRLYSEEGKKVRGGGGKVRECVR